MYCYKYTKQAGLHERITEKQNVNSVYDTAGSASAFLASAGWAEDSCAAISDNEADRMPGR